MIQSMTGFGEAQLEEAGQAYHVEVRSVNNRYFKASVRVPDEYAFLEAPLEQRLRRRLSRGSLTLRLFVRDLSESAARDINVAAVSNYVAQLRALLGSQANLTLDLAGLAALPGVCQPRELSEQERERCTERVLRLADAAIDRLIQMRTAEGAALSEDLRRHCALVRAQLDPIRQRAPVVLEEFRRKLTTRIAQLIAESGAALAEADVLKEVAIYAERSDVSEELSRLGSHLEQFEAALDEREPAGRKLDFIAQELMREANTLGAKSGDAEIARRVIEIKGAVDRLKEQVQNVE